MFVVSGLCRHVVSRVPLTIVFDLSRPCNLIFGFFVISLRQVYHKYMDSYDLQWRTAERPPFFYSRMYGLVISEVILSTVFL